MWYSCCVLVVVHRNDRFTVEEAIELNPVNIVISPGPGDATDSGISMDIIKAFEGKVPILGVCLGHQSMFHLYGGTVSNAPCIMHGKVSPMYHDGKGVFKGIPQSVNMARYHSLVGLRNTLPDCFEITCTSHDNKDVPLDPNPQGPDYVHGTIQGIRHKVFKVKSLSPLSQQTLFLRICYLF